jgi:hypothetical protein
MSTVKLLSMIFLAIFLIFSSLGDFLGLQLSWLSNFSLGVIALIAGILILLSSKEYYHYLEDEY